jgi:hypothetical protein
MEMNTPRSHVGDRSQSREPLPRLTIREAKNVKSRLFLQIPERTEVFERFW